MKTAYDVRDDVTAEQVTEFLKRDIGQKSNDPEEYIDALVRYTLSYHKQYREYQQLILSLNGSANRMDYALRQIQDSVAALCGDMGASLRLQAIACQQVKVLHLID